MMLYDPGRAYVSSRSLRWSWGSIIGRGDWQAQTSRLSPAAMARRLALAGFAGIWVDRWGYPDTAPRPWPTLEAELRAATGSELSVSSAGRYSFVGLAQLRSRIAAAMSPDALASARREALDAAVLLPLWREGCSDEVADSAEPSRVCGSRAWGVLMNDDAAEKRYLLQARIRPLRPGRLHIAGEGFQDELALDGGAVTYSRALTIPAERRRRIELAFMGECEDAGRQAACVEILDMKAVATAPEPAPPVR